MYKRQEGGHSVRAPTKESVSLDVSKYELTKIFKPDAASTGRSQNNSRLRRHVIQSRVQHLQLCRLSACMLHLDNPTNFVAPHAFQRPACGPWRIAGSCQLIRIYRSRFENSRTGGCTWLHVAHLLIIENLSGEIHLRLPGSPKTLASQFCKNCRNECTWRLCVA